MASACLSRSRLNVGSGVSAYTSWACFRRGIRAFVEAWLRTAAIFAPRSIRIGKAADRGPGRHQQRVLELHVRRREIGNSRLRDRHGAGRSHRKARLQALDSLGRSRMLKQNQFNSDPPRECARDLDPCALQITSRGSFTYCGGNSPKRSLPALTMSAMRASGLCCALSGDHARKQSQKNERNPENSGHKSASLVGASGQFLCVTYRHYRMGRKTTPSPLWVIRDRPGADQCPLYLQ